MAKLKTLDLDIWITQQALADEHDVSLQAVQNWIRRNKIKTLTLPGNTTLVDRTSLDINTNLGRPRNSTKPS